MLKIHDTLVVNLDNVVSIKRYDNEYAVTFFLWNGRVHNVKHNNLAARNALFCHVWETMKNDGMSLIELPDDDVIINADAVVSIVDLHTGPVVINFVTGNAQSVNCAYGEVIDKLIS